MSLSQPARLQVDPETITDDDKPPQTGHTFNVWYLKWAGGDSSGRDLPLSQFRVNIKQDSGYTKATDGRSPLCLFFARGCCYKGKDCHYSHRTPRASDVVLPTQDCFGRDKTTDYNDDMSGVGSLQKSNRTLYVSGLHMNDQVQEELSAQFSEFGAIDKIRVLHSKGCAFISFRLESEAQFAKEAMNQQTLDGKDVLIVKWANDDPNPTAHQSTKNHMEEMAMETVRRLLKSETDKNKKGKISKAEQPTKNSEKKRISTEQAESGIEKKETAGKKKETADIESSGSKKRIGEAPHHDLADHEAIFGAVRLNGVRNSRLGGADLQAAIHKARKIAYAQSTGLLAGYSSDSE